MAGGDVGGFGGREQALAEPAGCRLQHVRHRHHKQKQKLSLCMSSAWRANQALRQNGLLGMNCCCCEHGGIDAAR